MKMSFRSSRRSSPEKAGAENGEVEKRGREEFQREEGKDSNMDGVEGETEEEEFTLELYSESAQSIAARNTEQMNDSFAYVTPVLRFYENKLNLQDLHAEHPLKQM